MFSPVSLCKVHIFVKGLRITAYLHYLQRDNLPTFIQMTWINMLKTYC